MSFYLESTKLPCHLWKLFNQIDSIQFHLVICAGYRMYLNLRGLMTGNLNGYLGSIPSQDYVILHNFFLFSFSMLCQKNCLDHKQVLFCDKHKDSSTAITFLRWKKFSQISVRGYKIQIILDSYYMIFTIIFHFLLK